MNPVAFSLGSLTIYWYSLIICFAFVIGIFLVELEFKKKSDRDKDFISDMIFMTMICAIVGARLYYVIFNLDMYLSDPISIFKVWEGGLAIHGGILGGLSYIIYYTNKYKVNTLLMLDIAVPALILGQAIGRWGNFFNKEAYGSVVSRSFLENMHIPNFIIDNMYIGGNYHHPTFLYESILCLMGFIVLILIRKYGNVRVGILSSIYIIYYSLIRFYIESLRTDSLMLGNIKMAQAISIVGIVVGCLILIVIYFGKGKKTLYKEARI